MRCSTYTRFLALTSLLSVGLVTAKVATKVSNHAVVSHNDFNNIAAQAVPEHTHWDAQEVDSAHDHFAADSKVKREWVDFVERALGPTTPQDMIEHHLNQNRDTLDEAIRLELAAGNHDPSTHAHHELKAQSAEALRQSREHLDNARDIARVNKINNPAFQPHRREWVDIHERALGPITPHDMIEHHLKKQGEAIVMGLQHHAAKEDHHPSSDQHKWHLAEIDKYTKEAIGHYNRAKEIATTNNIAHPAFEPIRWASS